MEDVGTLYQSEVIHITNNYQKNDSFLDFVFTITQHSSASILVFAADKKLLTHNNSLGTFNDASASDLQTSITVSDYLCKHYVDKKLIKTSTKQCFCGKYSEIVLTKINGDRILIKFVPVIQHSKLAGVVIMADLWKEDNTLRRIRCM